MARVIVLAAAAALLGFSPAAAQSSRQSGGIPPATTGPGDRSGAVTATGQTKPPGTAVDGTLGTRPDLERRSRLLDLQIKNGICKGC